MWITRQDKKQPGFVYIADETDTLSSTAEKKPETIISRQQTRANQERRTVTVFTQDYKKRRKPTFGS